VVEGGDDAMANVRSKRKRIVTAWLDETLKARLVQYASERGETVTDVVTHLVRERLRDGQNYAETKPRRS
jgi:macrodomain Ter protein organizer (MatP/YcbG family)